jgi:hypothetical protein
MKKIIIFLFLFIKITSNGQVKKLYFIQGQPTNLETIEHNNELKVNLFSYTQSNKLDSICLLSQGSTIISFIKVYHEYKIALIFEKNIQDDNEKYLTIIDTQDSVQLNKIKINNNYSLCALNYLKIPEKGECLGLQFLNYQKSSTSFVYSGINKNGSEIEISPDDFCYSKVNGSQGLAFNYYFNDYLQLYLHKDGKLIIPNTTEESKQPFFPLTIPQEFRLDNTTALNMELNNDYLFALGYPNKPYIPNIKDIGYCNLLIYDKINNKWFLHKFEGVSTSFKVFNNWIAGTIASSNCTWKKVNGIRQKICIQRPSKGIDKRYPILSYMGEPADLRFEFFSLYYPGILSLFNVQTQDYIEWETNQGDSEILLIEDNFVYYRVFDEIYKAHIGYKQLENVTLIIKDIHVPEIHWAFFTKK